MTRGAAPGPMLSRHMVGSGQGGPKCHQGTGKLLWAARAQVTWRGWLVPNRAAAVLTTVSEPSMCDFRFWIARVSVFSVSAFSQTSDLSFSLRCCTFFMSSSSAFS